MLKQYGLEATDVVVIVAGLRELKKKSDLTRGQQIQINRVLIKFSGVKVRRLSDVK